MDCVSNRSKLSHKLFQSAIDPMKYHDFKMVIAVRTDLQMGKGKMAAQVYKYTYASFVYYNVN